MYQLPHWVWPTALMAVCAIAAWRGRDEERLAAAVVLADWALSVFVAKVRSEETQWAVLLVDAGQFAVFLWLVMRSQRFWPLFIAAFALLQLVTHMAHAIDVKVSGWAYQTAGLIWSYLILITIGSAAWVAPDREPLLGPHGPAGADPNAMPGATRR